MFSFRSKFQSGFVSSIVVCLTVVLSHDSGDLVLQETVYGLRLRMNQDQEFGMLRDFQSDGFAPEIQNTNWALASRIGQAAKQFGTTVLVGETYNATKEWVNEKWNGVVKEGLDKTYDHLTTRNWFEKPTPENVQEIYNFKSHVQQNLESEQNRSMWSKVKDNFTQREPFEESHLRSQMMDHMATPEYF